LAHDLPDNLILHHEHPKVEYNQSMAVTKYEIRLCQSCGLRYPLVENHPFGERCPSCLGSTKSILTHRIDRKTASLANKSKIRLEALLDNLRSAWNVGSIFRTADGLGVGKLHLCGITPTPENESVTKTSLGAEETVEWEYARNALETAQQLKIAGYKLIALEQDERSMALGDPPPSEDNATSLCSAQGDMLVLIVGNEITGIDPDLLNICDLILHIPMMGVKRSLNVEVAFGIAAFHLSRDRFCTNPG
jgi:tRNA G18 (ribose-2'-O)-methylase SpoU